MTKANAIENSNAYNFMVLWSIFMIFTSLEREFKDEYYYHKIYRTI